MAIRIIFEFDTPEEAAQLFARLPGLTRALPPAALPDPQDKRAYELSRPARYEAYKQNGGRRSFLGWAQGGEPTTPADEIDQTPGALTVINK